MSWYEEQGVSARSHFAIPCCVYGGPTTTIACPQQFSATTASLPQTAHLYTGITKFTSKPATFDGISHRDISNFSTSERFGDLEERVFFDPAGSWRVSSLEPVDCWRGCCFSIMRGQKRPNSSYNTVTTGPGLGATLSGPLPYHRAKASVAQNAGKRPRRSFGRFRNASGRAGFDSSQRRAT